ncbi:MAG: hypothetical protein ACRC8B_15405, partial [Aeromonas sobria]
MCEVPLTDGEIRGAPGSTPAKSLILSRLFTTWIWSNISMSQYDSIEQKASYGIGRNMGEQLAQQA